MDKLSFNSMNESNTNGVNYLVHEDCEMKRIKKNGHEDDKYKLSG